MRMKLVPVFLIFAVAIFAAGPTSAADASFVVEVVNALQDNYVDPLDRCELFNAAIDGLENILRDTKLVTTSESKFSTALERIPKEKCSQAQDHFVVEFLRAEKLAIGKVDRTELAFGATRHMAKSLKDSHVYFLAPEDNREIGENGYAGIGITIRKDGENIYVCEVFKGSPSDGILKPFDRVIAVGDYKVTKETELRKLTSLVVGPINTKVKITVIRYGEPEPLVFSLKKLVVEPPMVSGQMLEDGVGYVKLYTFFNYGVSLKFASKIYELEERGMKALILDLRGNRGGAVLESLEVAGMLLPPHTVLKKVKYRNKDEKPEFVSSNVFCPQLSIPLVVLIDSNSASASEVLSSALQEYGRATIVGVKSAAAVGVSMRLRLPEEAALNVTIARTVTPKGRVLEKVGVTPDVVVPFESKDYALGRDPQLLRALDIIKSKLK